MLKKISRNVFVFVIAIFFIVYFGVQVKNIFIDTMETQYAELATFDDTVEMKCYIVRDEILVTSDMDGVYNFLVSDGEKLSKGQIITNVYSSDKEYQNQEKIKQINSKISVLEDSSIENNFFTLNVNKLDSDIAANLLNYRNNILNGEYLLATKAKNEILTMFNKRYLVVNALTGFEDTIERYENEKNILMSKTSDTNVGIYAPSSGYFYSNTDGYENIFNPQILNTENADELIEILECSSGTTPENTVGKIVSDFDWYTVCVTDKVTAMLFTSDKYYEISYPYSVGTSVKSLLINKIVQSESGKAVLVFKTSNNLQSFNYTRNQLVEIKLDSYKGLRIKKEALRIVDGEEGVFILDGNTIEFKRAVKVYENDGYYVISPHDPAESENEENKYSYISMYDAVINNGKELYHGKTIG